MLYNFYHFVKLYYSQIKGDGIVTLLEDIQGLLIKSPVFLNKASY